MAKSLIERQEDGTIKLIITIPQKDIAQAREQVIESFVKNAEIPGFRKGHAPRNVVEERVSRDQLVEEILKKLLPESYAAAVQEHQLRPIMNPKLHVEKIEEGQDWVVAALTCEMPKVDLGKYKEVVKKVTAKSKIVLPGKEQQKLTVEEVVTPVLEEAKVKVPAILVEQETDRLLAQLLDDIKRLGLSLEQYLGTTRRSTEDLRAEYAQRAQNDIKLEFVMQKIAEEEKITVTEQEIEEAIQKAKDTNEKKNLEANRYVLAGILRQQKTLDFLMNL